MDHMKKLDAILQEHQNRYFDTGVHKSICSVIVFSVHALCVCVWGDLVATIIWMAAMPDHLTLYCFDGNIFQCTSCSYEYTLVHFAKGSYVHIMDLK